MIVACPAYRVSAAVFLGPRASNEPRKKLFSGPQNVRSSASERAASPLMCAVQPPQSEAAARPPVLGADIWRHEARRAAAQTRSHLARFGMTEANLRALVDAVGEGRGGAAQKAQASLRDLEDRLLGAILTAAAQPAAHAASLELAGCYTPQLVEAVGQLLDWVVMLEGMQIRADASRAVAPLTADQCRRWRALCTLLEHAALQPAGMQALSAEVCLREGPRKNLALLAARRALELANECLSEDGCAMLESFYALPPRAQAIARLRRQVLAPAHALAEEAAADMVTAVDGLRRGHADMPFAAAESEDAMETGTVDDACSVFWPFAD